MAHSRMIALNRLATLLIILLNIFAAQGVALARIGKPSPLRGVWSGAIGAYPVRVCLDTSRREIHGGYYYLNHRVPIALHRGGVDRLVEGGLRANGPQWQLVPVLNGEIQGQWRDGAKNLPILLHKEPDSLDDDQDMPCASRAFFNPLIEQIGWLDKPVQFGKTTYIRHDMVPTLSLAKSLSISLVQLDGSRPGDAQINAMLRSEEQARGAEGWVACFGMALGASSELGDYTHREQPIMLGATIVSLRASGENYCGGAHPNGGYSYANFDRGTGREIDIRTWFRAGTIAPSDPVATGPAAGRQILPLGALRETILAHYAEDDKECREAMSDDDIGTLWWVGLSPAGFVFAAEMPHVMQPCEIDIVLPMAAMVGFLTPQARAKLSGAMD